MGRRDVEGGIPSNGSWRGKRLPMELGDLLLRPLLDGDGVTIGRCAIDAAARSTHKERNPMGSSDKRQVVRAHLVGHITIGRNAITTHQHRIHLAPTHQQPAGPVDDHGAGHAQTPQLPGG